MHFNFHLKLGSQDWAVMSDFEPGRLLQSAAIYNNVELMESLLEGPEKNNVNMQDPFGRTALYTSVTNNSFECSELLLKNGGLF